MGDYYAEGEVVSLLWWTLGVLLFGGNQNRLEGTGLLMLLLQAAIL